MHSTLLFLVFLMAISAPGMRLFAQLEYVPPVSVEIKPGRSLRGAILLNTTDYHDQFGAPKHYPSSLQVIDPAQPWPPVYFTCAEPGGKGILGKGNFTTFTYHEISNQFSYYSTISTGQNPYGVFLLCDQNFNITDTVGAGKFYIDSHDFQVNSRGERLYMILSDTTLDLSSYSKNPADTAMLVTSQMIVIDDKNGKRIFRWNPLEHIAVSESFRKYNDLFDNNPYTKGWDWQHGNSAAFTHDGNIAYSFRFLGVGKINRNTGKIMWKLGGKHPTIPVPKGGEYYLQHDFREIAPDVYSVFSNGGKGDRPCRALVYRVNEETLKAELVRKYEPANPVLSISLGSYQTLDNGLCVINFGKYASLEPRQSMFEIIDTAGAVWAEYASPSLNFAYKVQYVTDLKLLQPVISETAGVLSISGLNYSVFWYRLNGSALEKAGSGFTYKPDQPGTFLAITKAGSGWFVSKPYVHK